MNRNRHDLCARQTSSPYGDDDAIFSIEDGEILEGKLPRNKRKLVEAWIEIHRDDLMTDWRLAVSGQNPIPIKPLE